MASKAKRGDLVVIERQEATWVAGVGLERVTVYDLGRVTSVTRDGQVKACEGLTHIAGNWRRDRRPGDSLYVIPPNVDKSALWDAHAERRYPNTDSAMVPPFDSLADVRELVRRFATASV